MHRLFISPEAAASVSGGLFERTLCEAFSLHTDILSPLAIKAAWLVISIAGELYYLGHSYNKGQRVIAQGDRI